MERNWTELGKSHTEGKHDEIGSMFDRLKWQTIPATLPFAPGEGLKEVIRELKIPKVYQVACSHELAPYGLMGVKAHYKNGDATIYMADQGDSIVILASDFYPNETTQDRIETLEDSQDPTSVEFGNPELIRELVEIQEL